MAAIWQAFSEKRIHPVSLHGLPDQATRLFSFTMLDMIDFR
jgi:hypothetical protein